MTQITIQGAEYDIPAKYTEGHVLTAGEASALNQTYFENIRNNMAARIRKHDEAVKAAEAEGKPAPVMDVAAEVAAYAESYEFGVRGERTPTDPLEAEMYKIADKAVRDALKQAGHKLKEVADQVDGLVEQYLSQFGDEIRPVAERNLQDRKTAAARILGSLQKAA